MSRKDRPDGTSAPALTLADIVVEHRLGEQTTEISGADLARMIKYVRAIFDHDLDDIVDVEQISLNQKHLAELAGSLFGSESTSLQYGPMSVIERAQHELAARIQLLASTWEEEAQKYRVRVQVQQKNGGAR